MAAVKASATYPAPRAAAWAIHLAYPVALERTVATEMERTDLRMAVIRARCLRQLSARSGLRLRLSARRLPSLGGSQPSAGRPGASPPAYNPSAECSGTSCAAGQ